MEWDLDVQRVKAHRTGKEKKAMTKDQKIVVEGNEKTCELAKEGAYVDGGHMAVAKALDLRVDRQR